MNVTTTERLLRKISQKMIPVLAPYRRKRLNNTDFSIISNNCWGGVCYEWFGLQKLSPTVGTYFFADDYIKFVSNLKYYTSLDIEMIDAKDSRYSDELKKRNQMNVPVGKLGDVEIVFLHYKDPDIAKDKWSRRVKRINWENLILKFSYMNCCTDEHIHQFEKIDGYKSFVFVSKPFEKYNNAILVPGYDGGQIDNDTFYWNKYFDVVCFLNASYCGESSNIVSK